MNRAVKASYIGKNERGNKRRIRKILKMLEGLTGAATIVWEDHRTTTAEASWWEAGTFYRVTDPETGFTCFLDSSEWFVRYQRV